MVRRKKYDNKRRWTQEEQAYLDRHYGLVRDETISKHLHRTIGAVRQRARKTGIKRTSNFLTALAVSRIFGVAANQPLTWIRRGHLKARKSKVVSAGRRWVWVITLADVVAFMREHRELYDIRRINVEEHAYWRNIANRAVPNGYVPKCQRNWTEQEDAFILNHHGRLTEAQIGKALRRTKEAVHYRKSVLRAKGHLLPYKMSYKKTKPTQMHARWTPAEDRYIIAHWGQTAPDEIARQLGRPEMVTLVRAGYLGVTIRGKRRRRSKEEVAA